MHTPPGMIESGKTTFQDIGHSYRCTLDQPTHVKYRMTSCKARSRDIVQCMQATQVNAIDTTNTPPLQRGTRKNKRKQCKFTN